MSIEKQPKPFIPAHRQLPEITIKGTILAIILTIILGAANSFLALRVGVTVSASIPAAVISMGVLRFFKHSNVLENNIVQTSASMGEAMTSGLAFILPALVILHYWVGFYYWETVMITLLAGFLGVLFGIPIRRVLINDKTLRFPEGTAIGEVLKASASSSANLGYLIGGGALGGLISLCQSGFGLFAETFSYWTAKANGAFAYGFGWGYAPALIAAGYIVGTTVAVSLTVGVLIGWVFGIPILSYFYGVPPAGDIGMTIWAHQIRYIGVGTMLIGGLWTVITLTKQIYIGVKKSATAMKQGKKSGAHIPRTERDIPINIVFWALLIVLALVFIFIFNIIDANALGISHGMVWALSILGVLFVLIMGFILCSVSAYFAGLVGSTNNPASGLMVSGLLILCLLMAAAFSIGGFTMTDSTRIATAAVAIVILTMIASGLVITNETIQDLKAGQIVGATPWKQQIMLVLGCVVSAFVLPAVLQLLFNAYGIGGVFPRPGMDPAQMLAAPQANMMAAVAKGVFYHDLPWTMIIVGAIVAVISIVVDEFLKKAYNMRLPVLALGLGIYLPLDASVPTIIGGLLAFIIQIVNKRRKEQRRVTIEDLTKAQHDGLLLACGIVAGAALMGVVLAIPFAIAKNSQVLRFVSSDHMILTNTLSILFTLGLCALFYRVVCRKEKRGS